MVFLTKTRKKGYFRHAEISIPLQALIYSDRFSTSYMHIMVQSCIVLCIFNSLSHFDWH